ncbi:hypothetical protein V8C86DRAFT_3092085 [Haematococcus lacustris]
MQVVLWYHHQVCIKDNADDDGCITEVLECLPTCAVVQQLSLQRDTDKYGPTHFLSWPSSRTQLLRECFPSLSALSVSGFLLESRGLAGLLDASRQLGLQQLHVTWCKMVQQAFSDGVNLEDVFIGCRLQQLSLDMLQWEVRVPKLQPLAPHLTHLTLALDTYDPSWDLPQGSVRYQDCWPQLQGLSQLRVLHVKMPEPLPVPTPQQSIESNSDLGFKVVGELDLSNLTQLVQSLPSLHSLRIPWLRICDGYLEPLLAVTQLTHIKLLFQSQLNYSYDDAACSWRHLEWEDYLSGPEVLETLAYLPLHSLTHPLHIPELVVDADQDDLYLATTAVESLASRCKVPVSIGSLTLLLPTAPEGPCTDGGVQLAAVEALVAQLHNTAIRAINVRGLHAVTPSTVRSLAPACRAANSVSLQGGPMAPGMEVWLELLGCMPAMTHLDVTGLNSHLGDMEQGLWQLCQYTSAARSLEVELWDGPAQPSPAQPSPAQPSPAQPSPAQPSPAQPSPAQPSPAQPSPAQPSPAQPSPAQPSPAQPSPASPAQPSPAQPSPAQPSPAQPSPAQPSPAQPSPAQPSPAQPSPAQPSPAQPSPAQPSPAQPSPAQPSPAQPSPAQPSPAQPSPAQPSPAQPSPAPAQPSPAQPSPAQPAQPSPASPAQPSPAQPSPAQPSPAQPSQPARPPGRPARPGPARPGPARPGPARPARPGRPGPARPGPARPDQTRPDQTRPDQTARPAQLSQPSQPSEPSPAIPPVPYQIISHTRNRLALESAKKIHTSGGTAMQE